MSKNIRKNKGPIKSQRVSCAWTKMGIRRGIDPRPTKPSPFIQTVPDEYRKNFWRDAAKRHDIMKRMDKFLENPTLSINERLYNAAFSSVTSLLDEQLPDLLTEATFSEIFSETNKQASSGYPSFQKKGMIREKMFRTFSRDLKNLSADWRLRTYPCSPGSRSSVRERPENKPRLFWIYPSHISNIEARFALPLLEKITKLPQFGWSLRWLDDGKGYFDWRRRFTAPGVCSYNLDFSSYDATVPAFVIHDLFMWLRTKFPQTPVNAHAWRFIEYYFIHTPIALYDATYQKHRGIPSGSYFTSLIGSLVNLVFQEYALLQLGGHRRDVCVLGDDSLSSWYTGPAFDPTKYPDLIARIAKQWGMTINADKSSTYVDHSHSSYDVTIKFLGQQLISTFPYIKREPADYYTRMMWPEREDEFPCDTMQRLIGLVWAYGNDPQAYSALSLERKSLITRYPWVASFDYSKWRPDSDTHRYFKFVLAEGGDKYYTWPSYELILSRYFGLSSYQRGANL